MALVDTPRMSYGDSLLVQRAADRCREADADTDGPRLRHAAMPEEKREGRGPLMLLLGLHCEDILKVESG